ncbi:MAG TPA: hypothetical protein VEK34_15545 [Methylocella sp.]|nr:hypothetical protein [Methylocella sp.]
MSRRWMLKAAVAILPMLAVSTLALTPRSASLKYPYALAVDQEGLLYIADPGNAAISVYHPASNKLSSFAQGGNAVSLALDKNGRIYAGMVGPTGRIDIYDRDAKLADTLPVPRGDLPMTLAVDSDGVLYQSSGSEGGKPAAASVNAYDIVVESESAKSGFSNKRQSYAVASDQPAFALAYDGYSVRVLSSAFAAAADGNHNIFYTDPDAKSIAVKGESSSPKIVLTKLSSEPRGIAFDKARSVLYVSFPNEHAVRAYQVSYNGGADAPALSSPRVIIH